MSECVIWAGARDRKGYGRLNVPGLRGPRGAHRVAYVNAFGPVPVGLMVLHRCDNPPCVNPEHLFVGTAADNASDRDRKGRQARGSRHGHARLTEQVVVEIRRLRTQGLTNRTIANQFGVSRQAVADAASGRRWGWL